MTLISVRTLATLSLAALLAACGGGDDSGKPLSIADDAPAAHTLDYLDDHPDELVQPEHLIIVRLDPSTSGGAVRSARLHIREPMTLSLDSTSAAAAVSQVTIEDSAGKAQLSHQPAEPAGTVTLQPGAYRIVFKAHQQLSAPRTLFLKLADTPTQAARRRADSGTLVSKLSLQNNDASTVAPAALGALKPDCIKCNFDNADLSNQDFSNTYLTGSTFNNTLFRNTNMQSVFCFSCVIAPVGIGQADFTNAYLGYSVVSGHYYGVLFRGANFTSSRLVGDFQTADFSPSTTQPTVLRSADLTQVILWKAKIQYADFSGASVLSIKNLFEYGIGGAGNDDLLGTKFDNMTPVSLWTTTSFAGMDLTGTSFSGMDMSSADLSIASGTKITLANYTTSILSNGTKGANLSGQDFGTGFKGWAGSADGLTPGADLRGVNLSNANLFQADLTGVNLSGAVLIGADLTSSSLNRAKLVGAQMGVAPSSASSSAANLSDAYMPQADFTDADLRSVKFDNAHVYGNVKFLRARVDSASMTGTNLAEADFTNASLANTNFTQALLINTIFSGASLNNAQMGKAYLQGASFANTVSVSGLSMLDAYFSLQSGSWSFKESDGSPFVYGYGATVLGDLATTNKGAAICPNGEYSPCTDVKLQPTTKVPYPPPPPQCIPVGPDYDNCLAPN